MGYSLVFTPFSSLHLLAQLSPRLSGIENGWFTEPCNMAICILVRKFSYIRLTKTAYIGEDPSILGGPFPKMFGETSPNIGFQVTVIIL